jgi:hypothetical protein
MAQPQYTRTELAQAGQAWPRFYTEAVQDEGASKEAGRAIFRERELVEIFLPGNTLSRPVEIVRDTHRQQWPEQYAAFKAGQEPSTDGTPLEEWPALGKAQVLELKHVGFRSVEDVAGMGDIAIQRIGMGARALKERAAAFLDDAERMASLERKSAEVTQLIDRLAAAEAQIRELGTLLQNIHAERLAQRQGEQQMATAPLTIPGVPEVAKEAASSLDRIAAPRRPPLTAEQREEIGKRLKAGREAKREAR